ncbi:MAG: hypothetical protein ACJAYU_002314 [Bradymonadia bacterium]|jgi:hypothetical protein
MGEVPPASNWSQPQPPPNFVRQPSGGGGGKKFLLGAVAVCVLGFVGILALGSMLPGTGAITLTEASVDERTQGAFVHFTMVVDELPESESVNPASISVRLESVALREGTLDFGWDVIALKDDRPESLPGQAPPIGAEMRVSLLIEPHLLSEVSVYENDGVWLYVHAMYDGKKKDKYSIEISDLYGL